MAYCSAIPSIPISMGVPRVLPCIAVTHLLGNPALPAPKALKALMVKQIGIAMLILAFGFNFIYYLNQYFVQQNYLYSESWQYGYKQLVGKVNQYEKNYERIEVTESLGRPYIYFLLYNQVNPLDYVQMRRADRDYYGFWSVC